MKCIVIETSPERTNAKPVTNEDGTPHIYATMGEARAELKANGYIYNRANQRYYINGTEYRAYILRTDSEEYAEIVEQAEQQQAPEYIEPEHIQTVSGNKIYRSIDPVTGWNVFTVAGRDFWELAEARYFAQCNPAEPEAIEQAEQNAAEAAERAEIIASIEDPEHRAYIEHEATAHQWSPEETRANIEYRATIHTANRAALALLDAYAEAIGEHPHEDDDETRAAYKVARDDVTGTSARATEYDRETVAAMVERIAQAVRDDIPTGPENYRPTYQRCELEAFLGEPDDYDIDAIEAEATRFTADGARVWVAFGDDLAAIAERHELVTYYAI